MVVRYCIMISLIALFSCIKQQDKNISTLDIFMNEKEVFSNQIKTYDSIATYIEQNYMTCDFFMNKQLYFRGNDVNSIKIANYSDNVVHITDSYIVNKMKSVNISKIEVDRIEHDMVNDIVYTSSIQFYPNHIYEYKKIIYEYHKQNDNHVVNNSRIYRAKLDSLWAIIIEHTGSL